MTKAAVKAEAVATAAIAMRASGARFSSEPDSLIALTRPAAARKASRADTSAQPEYPMRRKKRRASCTAGIVVSDPAHGKGLVKALHMRR